MTFGILHKQKVGLVQTMQIFALKCSVCRLYQIYKGLPVEGTSRYPAAIEGLTVSKGIPYLTMISPRSILLALLAFTPSIYAHGSHGDNQDRSNLDWATLHMMGMFIKSSSPTSSSVVECSFAFCKKIFGTSLSLTS